MNWLREQLPFTYREFLSLGGNMLTNSLKISGTTKKKFLEEISFHSDKKIRQKYYGADLWSVSDPLTC